MAIKINVSQKDQEALNRTLESAGYEYQKRKFHCTVGFIERMIPPEESIWFGDSITTALQERIDHEPLPYEVDTAAHLFGHVIVFLPTIRSQEYLENINLWIFNKVQEISEDRWELNKESQPINYIPHLTLWHTHRPDQRFQKLKKFSETHPIYHLTKAGYVLFNQ